VDFGMMPEDGGCMYLRQVWNTVQPPRVQLTSTVNHHRESPKSLIKTDIRETGHKDAAKD
jgi:hypothetical protein